MRNTNIRRPLEHLQRAIGFAVLVDVAYGLIYLDKIYVGGREAFQLQTSDVVVVTGGSSGLGRALAIIFRTKGVDRVISLDTTLPPDAQSGHTYGIEHVHCDIADDSQVEAALLRIRDTYGYVSVLVNNAGVLTGSTSVVSTSKDSIRKTIDVNLLGSIWTIKSVLPDMLQANRGYIINIASVLGYLGPGGAALYAASKGGLIAFHDSLRHELANTKIKTLLVTPGQLRTPMFNGVKTPNSMIAPILDPMIAAMQIVQAIENSRGGTIAMPFYCKFLPWINVLPTSIADILRTIFKIDKAMNDLKT